MRRKETEKTEKGMEGGRALGKEEYQQNKSKTLTDIL